MVVEACVGILGVGGAEMVWGEGLSRPSPEEIREGADRARKYGFTPCGCRW